MARKAANPVGLNDLLYQSLEAELGGVQVYQTALTCAVNEDLRKEWQKYLEETRTHVEVLRNVLESMGLDPEQETPGRQVVRTIGEALVAAMEQARVAATPEQAEIVACEAVVFAETKDHTDWELMKHAAERMEGEGADVLKRAVEAVEDQEDHHLYHTRGWCRELWIQALGFPAVLPPPEEVKNVETMIGAAKAEQNRADML